MNIYPLYCIITHFVSAVNPPTRRVIDNLPHGIIENMQVWATLAAVGALGAAVCAAQQTPVIESADPTRITVDV